jgi:hypothetical protein
MQRIGAREEVQKAALISLHLYLGRTRSHSSYVSPAMKDLRMWRVYTSMYSVGLNVGQPYSIKSGRSGHCGIFVQSPNHRLYYPNKGPSVRQS